MIITFHRPLLLLLTYKWWRRTVLQVNIKLQIVSLSRTSGSSEARWCLVSGHGQAVIQYCSTTCAVIFPNAQSTAISVTGWLQYCSNVLLIIFINSQIWHIAEKNGIEVYALTKTSLALCACVRVLVSPLYLCCSCPEASYKRNRGL